MAVAGAFRRAESRFREPLKAMEAGRYRTHPSINPNGIVPIGPEIDFTTPHGRG